MIMRLHSVFHAGNGEEHFFTRAPARGGSFTEEVLALREEYRRAIAGFGCSADSEFLLRFHCSDVVNQAPILKKMLGDCNSFVSIIGQPPADKCRLALEAWHILPMRKSRLDEHSFLFTFRDYRILLTEGADSEAVGSYDQTAGEFASLDAILAKLGGKVADHTVRTWLYCRDVDNNYAGLVRARNDYFDTIGLTSQTHFIASTGIEGLSAKPSRLVTMDSISIPELDRKQFIYLSAPEMLSPTAIYNVRFERGTRIVFGDRSHYFVSGTASIDKFGKVLYPDDVRMQTRRMLDNTEALLGVSDGTLADLKQATVYLRDIADAEIVREELEKRLPAGLPLVILKAPVCRPAWLVEMESIAINAKGGDFPPLA